MEPYPQNVTLRQMKPKKGHIFRNFIKYACLKYTYTSQVKLKYTYITY